MPLRLPLVLFPDKDEMRNRVPCIVNTDKEEEEHCRTSQEHTRAIIGSGNVSGHGKHSVCPKGKQNMEQPVLEHRLVCGLNSHPARNDKDVCHPAKSHQAPDNGNDIDSLPWSAYQC